MILISHPMFIINLHALYQSKTFKLVSNELHSLHALVSSMFNLSIDVMVVVYAYRCISFAHMQIQSVEIGLCARLD